MITATGHRSEFGYDGFSRRVEIRELDPDQTKTLQVSSDQKYLWEGTHIAEARTADGGTVLQRFYAQGFVDSDGTELYYTKDHLGSIRELTDGQQIVRARYDYDPWGRMTQLQGDRTSVFGYTGHFWHAQSGLDLTWFRAYDPNLGRWINRDPIGVSGGINLYRYAGNKPINFTDRTGLAPGDKYYGLPKQFWNWYHRQVKGNGDPDLTKDEANDYFKDWKDLGKPGPDDQGNPQDQPNDPDNPNNPNNPNSPNDQPGTPDSPPQEPDAPSQSPSSCSVPLDPSPNPASSPLPVPIPVPSPSNDPPGLPLPPDWVNGVIVGIVIIGIVLTDGALAPVLAL